MIGRNANSSVGPSGAVPALIQRARDEGDLSAQSLDAIMLAADIGAQIQAGLGVAPDDVPSSEVTLVTMMPDDSGSIRSARNEDAVRAGHNEVLDTLERSKQADGVLVHTRYLNGQVLYPYRPLAGAPRMTASNYKAVHGTPLYDQTVVLLGTVLAKAKELEGAGIPVRTVTLLVTDGADAHSSQQTPQSVRRLVEDLRRTETHVVAAMGIDDGSTDFRRVFHDMGIPDEWILTLGSSASDIRAAFRLFSQSAVRVSQAAGVGAGAFGGFGG
jgi:hypothetical protein